MITKPELVAIGCSERSADRWLEHLNACMDCFGIDTPLRAAAFLSQVCHESGLLTVIEESLNYSAGGLLKIFGKYFTAAEAESFARHPEKIANRVYASRMGNGDEDSGDGWRFRGRGLIQLTGRESYRACGKALGLDLEGSPDLLLAPRPASMSAGWEWDKRNINKLLEDADLNDLDQVSDIINLGHLTKKVGDSNGYADRLELFKKSKDALGV